MIRNSFDPQGIGTTVKMLVPMRLFPRLLVSQYTFCFKQPVTHFYTHWLQNILASNFLDDWWPMISPPLSPGSFAFFFLTQSGCSTPSETRRWYSFSDFFILPRTFHLQTVNDDARRKVHSPQGFELAPYLQSAMKTTCPLGP